MSFTFNVENSCFYEILFECCPNSWVLVWFNFEETGTFSPFHENKLNMLNKMSKCATEYNVAIVHCCWIRQNFHFLHKFSIFAVGFVGFLFFMHLWYILQAFRWHFGINFSHISSHCCCFSFVGWRSSRLEVRNVVHCRVLVVNKMKIVTIYNFTQSTMEIVLNIEDGTLPIVHW